MPKETRQRLFNDDISKECGKCHEIKFNKEFRKRQGRLRSICEKCRNDLNLVKNFQKKLKIITENYNGECLKCRSDIVKLPVFEFHHPNPKIKSYSWKSLRGKSYINTLQCLMKDNVIVVCKNCHVLLESVSFKEFKPIILLPSIFYNTSDEIENVINTFLQNNQFVKKKEEEFKYYKSKAKYVIKKWIKKRYIIEKLFNSKCVGCEEITVTHNLPALGFHHITPCKKDIIIKWDKIYKYNIQKIIDLIRNEKCICLCSNCHSILHSTSFIRNIDEVFGNKYMCLINKFRSDYNSLITNINRYDIDQHFGDSIIKEII
ncbi:MAG: hypothetical protein JSV23_01195 [Promethearchaeota archaeon]|nr:MAG: hypothetical protein JSV23_01195 [Candidatus Lokiarchaeota archaeon]